MGARQPLWLLPTSCMEEVKGLSSSSGSKSTSLKRPQDQLEESNSRFIAIQPKPLPPTPPPPPLPVRNLRVPTRRRPLQLVCPVGLCRRLNCPLRTHKQYARLINRQSETTQQDDTEDSKPRGRSVSPPLIIGGVDGLPALPIDGPDLETYRTLFHDFFMKTCDRIVLLLHPPPVNPSQRAFFTKWKRDALSTAFSSPVYCLNYIAAAYFEQVFRKHGHTRNRTTVALYGKLLQLLRQKLNNFQVSDHEDLVVVIYTLVLFDSASGKTDSLNVHRMGLDQIVSRAGGVHNLGRSLQYAMSMDRHLSVYTGQQPLYSSRSNRALLRPVRFPQTYGSFFENKERLEAVDPCVINYCHDVCRAIELLEGQHIEFDPKTSIMGDAPDCQYFYFLRTSLANEFTFLNAKYTQEATSIKCILLTAQIVQYFVLNDNYVVTATCFLADRIREIIELHDDKDEFWNGMRDALHWTLFVLAALPPIWEGANWAMNLLEETIKQKYVKHDVWASGWKHTEMQNLRRFVWSDTRLNRHFIKICKLIEEHATQDHEGDEEGEDHDHDNGDDSDDDEDERLAEQ